MTGTQPQNRRLGYARVSSYGQTLDAQLEQLRADGCGRIYREQASGARADRRELQRMLKEGCLESEAGISAKGRPTRIYRVTDAGMRRLEQDVSSFEKMFAGITRVLAVAQA